VSNTLARYSKEQNMAAKGFIVQAKVSSSNLKTGVPLWQAPALLTNIRLWWN
jgi:hypothetical protein